MKVLFIMAWLSSCGCLIAQNGDSLRKSKPLKVVVLDFTAMETKASERFSDNSSKIIDIPTLKASGECEQSSINKILQGVVSLIGAYDTLKSNDLNRSIAQKEYKQRSQEAATLYQKVMSGEGKSIVLGADYLSAYLGRRNDCFSCLDQSLIVKAMEKLQGQKDFPSNFMQKLASATGTTHLIYGTVSNLRSKESSFKGYGVETKTTNYSLDVIIKVVDLVNQQGVYGNVYTGVYQEQRPISGSQFDNNIFQNLMTSALEQAAEDLHDRVKSEHLKHPVLPGQGVNK